ncbi:MAG: lysophospholipid acyltransferase family protein [Planctomycetota bacterium]
MTEATAPDARHGRGGRLLYGFLRAVAAVVFRLYFRLRSRGLEGCPAGPLIIVANHTSFLDPFVLQATFRRRIVFMVTSAFYDLRRFRWFLQLMGCIRVKDGVSRKAIDEALAVLARGGVVGIFPEGGISRHGWLLPAQPGAAALMLRADVPILPAYIGGLFAAFPRHAWFPRPRSVEVRYGKPIRLPQRDATVPRKRLTGTLTRDIMRVLADLGGVPAPEAARDPTLSSEA